MVDVVLAVLPFADVDRPAIGVSLLKAEAEQRGHGACVEYLNIGFAERIGLTTYNLISEGLPSESLIGEWFFADGVFRDSLPPEQEYLAKILARYADPTTIASIRAARSARAAFADQCAEQILRHKPSVVGFTTTFHQTCACLLVAQRLKASPTPPVVIFGGANCEGEMGLQMIRSFPWIDFVCTREGDEAFPEFLDWLLRQGQRGPPPLGILQRGVSNDLSLPPIVHNMDGLPLPDYVDYFQRIQPVPFREELEIELPVETARGCWWGALHHCTFCGLNGDTMGFRSKSPQRVINEFAALSDRYGVARLNCVDNILEHKYIETVFPALASSGRKLQLFFEVKANLKLAQLKTLHDGGVRMIQPGIESFSDKVLALMDKGCTGAQNIQLLRWCDEVGITPLWNLLAGFPGEDPQEYERMAEFVPTLVHLPPPTSCAPIRLDRFSPLFVRGREAGIENVRPTTAYYYVYPLGRRELARLAYFFDFDYSDRRKPETYLSRVRNEIGQWLKSHSGEAGSRPQLDADWSTPDEVAIRDSRPCATQPVHDLRGTEARVLRVCDTARSSAGLARELSDESAQALGSALEALQGKRLLLNLNGRFVCLPVFRRRQPQSQEQVKHVDARNTEAAPA